MTRIVRLLLLTVLVASAAWTPPITPRRVVVRDGLFVGVNTPDSAAWTNARMRQFVQDSAGGGWDSTLVATGWGILLTWSGDTGTVAIDSTDSAFVDWVAAHGSAGTDSENVSGLIGDTATALRGEIAAKVDTGSAANTAPNADAVQGIDTLDAWPGGATDQQARDTGQAGLDLARTKADTSALTAGLAAKVDTGSAANTAPNADLLQGKDTTDLDDAESVSGNDSSEIELRARLGAASGYCGLDGSGLVDGDDLPALSASKKGAAPATGTPSGKFLRDDATWQTVGGSGTVTSVEESLGIKCNPNPITGAGKVYLDTAAEHTRGDALWLGLHAQADSSAQADSANRAHVATTADSTPVAANAHTLQTKDTTALWNAKTLQGKDTTALVRTPAIIVVGETVWVSISGADSIGIWYDSTTATRGWHTIAQGRNYRDGSASINDSIVTGYLAVAGSAMPADSGDNGEVLTSDGAGTLSWTAAAGAADSIFVYAEATKFQSDHAFKADTTESDSEYVTKAYADAAAATGYSESTKKYAPTTKDSFHSLRADGVAARPYGLYYESDFVSAVDFIDPWTVYGLVSGVWACDDGTASHPGMWKITSAGAANSGGVLLWHTASVLLAGGEFTGMIFRADSLQDATIFFGWHDAYDENAPTDGVYFRVLDSVCKGFTSSNGTKDSTIVVSEVPASYKLTPGAFYELYCRVNVAHDSAFFLINNGTTGENLWTNHVATQIPTVAGRVIGNGLAATATYEQTWPILAVDRIEAGIPRVLLTGAR